MAVNVQWKREKVGFDGRGWVHFKPAVASTSKKAISFQNVKGNCPNVPHWFQWQYCLQKNKCNHREKVALYPILNLDINALIYI